MSLLYRFILVYFRSIFERLFSEFQKKKNKCIFFNQKFIVNIFGLNSKGLHCHCSDAFNIKGSSEEFNYSTKIVQHIEKTFFAQ